MRFTQLYISLAVCCFTQLFISPVQGTQDAADSGSTNTQVIVCTVQNGRVTLQRNTSVIHGSVNCLGGAGLGGVGLGDLVNQVGCTVNGVQLGAVNGVVIPGSGITVVNGMVMSLSEVTVVNGVVKNVIGINIVSGVVTSANGTSLCVHDPYNGVVIQVYNFANGALQAVQGLSNIPVEN